MQFIAIPTFDRGQELSACLACLGEARGLDDWQVVICDDASTEIDILSVADQAPFRCNVTRNSVNLGCDENNIALLKSCLNAGAQRIFLLDSDLVVAPDALEFINTTFGRTDGILSVYNSVLHAPGEVIDGDLVCKHSIGAAGTVWDADLLRRILDQLEGAHLWDWQMCRIVRNWGVRLYVARASRAQHIGIIGTNSRRFGELEYGRGFSIETAQQAHAIAAAHQTLMLSQNNYLDAQDPLAPRRPLYRRWINSLNKRLNRVG